MAARAFIARQPVDPSVRTVAQCTTWRALQVKGLGAVRGWERPQRARSFGIPLRFSIFSNILTE